MVTPRHSSGWRTGLTRCWPIRINFLPGPTDDYRLRGDQLTFPSAHETPHPKNNVVHARYFPADYERNASAPRMGVVVLPQWNADRGGHVGLCRLLARTGLSALRLSLP